MIRKDKAFVVVSREMWTALHAWYGGGPALPRKVVERRDSKSDSTSLCVDIFDDDQKQSSTDDSKSETCEKRTSASTTMSTAFDCSACGRRGAENRCGRCKVVRYCQRSCQESHWPVRLAFVCDARATPQIYPLSLISLTLRRRTHTPNSSTRNDVARSSRVPSIAPTCSSRVAESPE